MFQEQRAVAAIVGIGMLHQEFHVADQMRQAELHEHMAVLHVLAVGAKVVTADQTVELLAEHVEQNLRAARAIDGEHREEGRPKAPRPQALPGVGVAGLIDVQARFLGQGAEQFLVGCFQAGTHFLHQLGQLSAADGEAHHVAEKSTDGGERGMTDPLEKGDQRRQARPHQAALDHFGGNRGVMHALTVRTPVGQSSMRVDAQGHLCDLDLLEHAGSRVGLFQGPAAVGALIECVIMGRIDLFRSKRRAVVGLMAHLTATLSLAAVLRLVLGLLDDISGGRLGRA